MQEIYVEVHTYFGTKLFIQVQSSLFCESVCKVTIYNNEYDAPFFLDEFSHLKKKRVLLFSISGFGTLEETRLTA